MRLARPLAALALAAALGPSPASASLFCEIRPTRDGFAALRAGPAPDAALLHRMRPGDEVMIYPGRRGRWIEVAYWRGGRWRTGTNPAGDPVTAVGWMHEALLKPDSCG